MLTGCVPVLITPFNEDRSIDFAAFERILEHLKKQGAEALWVLGTGAEDMAIPFDKRLAIVNHLSLNYSSEFQLLVGCSFFSFEETIRFVNAVAGLNISGIHYMPYQPLIGLEQLKKNYKSLAAVTGFPVWLYTSANWSRHIPPSFLEDFAEDNAFAGCKYSTSNIVDTEEALGYQTANFQILPAVVKQCLASLSLGARAFTTVEAMVHLEKINQIIEAFNDGALDVAQKKQRELNVVLSKLSTGAGRQNFLKTAEIKGVMSKMGLCERWVASGLADVTEEDTKKLYAIYTS